MSNKENYQLSLERTLCSLEGLEQKKTLLLHACCAPCSSYVLEYLSRYFKITLLYYNPNISPREEYDTRAEELLRLAGAMNGVVEGAEDIRVAVADYDPAPFYELAKGKEALAEGGARCMDCYRLRLEYTVKAALEGGYDYFCTTLSISPHKNASALNGIGKELSERYGVPYLYSDFKKNGGYLRSCELSGEYGLYRQDYCGCEFSKARSQEKN